VASRQLPGAKQPPAGEGAKGDPQSGDKGGE
jgi:hypothetical protein